MNGQRLLSIKHDTAMIEAGQHSAVVQAVNSKHHVGKACVSIRTAFSCFGNFSGSSKATGTGPGSPCWSCGPIHYSKDCPFKKHQCHECRQVGHKDGYCSSERKARSQRSPNKRFSPRKTKSVVMKNVKKRSRFVSALVNDRQINLQLDTASDISIISEKTWRRIGRPTSSPWALFDALQPHQHPLSLPQDIFAKLDNCKVAKPFKHSKLKEKVKTRSIHTVRNIGNKRKFIPVELSIGLPAAQPTEESAITASGGIHNLLAEFQAEITIKNVTETGRIFISDSAGLNVLGIETIDLFDLWSVPIISLVNAVHHRPDQHSDQYVSQLKQHLPEVFRNTLGKCTKAQVKLYLEPDARLSYWPKRPVAYAALLKVGAELERLQMNGIISPVQFSDGAAPIVVVRKADNISVHVRGDYSTGLNNALECDHHPRPHPDDLFAQLTGVRYFTHLDLSDAFLQVEMEEDSRKPLTVNTHRGLFQYNRLLPGVKSVPGA